MVTLFDDKPREALDPAGHSEPDYSYLDRSGRPEYEVMRTTFESWFSRFPQEHQVDLAARFRSADQHESALLELVLAETVRCLGCSLEPHPELAGEPTKPDFRVIEPSSNAFYLEARLAQGQSEAQLKEEARRNVLYDGLNRLNSPNFFISVDVLRAGPNSAPTRKIRDFVENRLSGLDPDVVDGDQELPEWVYDGDAWVVRLMAVPKSPKARGETGIRPLGIMGLGAGQIDSVSPVRAAVVKKGNHYGKLDRPLVVAVNGLDPFLHDDEVLEALFGDLQWRMGPQGVKTIVVPNGAWTCRSGPRYRRVSAMLFLKRLRHWNVPTVSVRLVHNPWAYQPYDGVLCRLPQVKVDASGKFGFLDGETLGSILHLPEKWPEI